jgi:DNA ligase-1
MPVLLIDLARTLDIAASTTGKLAKQKALAELFATAAGDDLRRAVRYADGRAFAKPDERVLGTSSAIVSEVVLDMLGLDPGTYRSTVIRRGEIGEAVGEFWPPAPEGAEAILTLGDLAEAFDALGATTLPAAKKPVVRGLFARCVEPREACYLAKIILSDMRTGVREGVLQAAVAEAFGATLAEVLRAQLLTGDLGDVAVLAAEKRLADAAFKLFNPLGFMLATPIESAAEIDGTSEYVVEDKLDGIRAQAHISGNRVALYTRTLDRTDESFPDVVRQLRRVNGDVLLDGEIVPWRDGRALPFGVLQKRLGRKTVSAKQLADNPAVLIAFDLLYLDGRLLLDEPLERRQSLLRELAARNPSLIVLPSANHQQAEQIQLAFDAARTAGNEGLMLKDPKSTYTPGRRGGAWLKLKSHLPTLDCVVVAAEYGHGRRRSSLSDYTFAVWDRDPAEAGATLVNLAKAYSGVTDAEIAELTQLFLSLAISDNGRVFQVKPHVVMELAFDQILESNRHASGFALRFPRIKRIRTDKRIEDADRLDRVREIYQSVGNLGRKHEPPTALPAAAEPTLFDAL